MRYLWSIMAALFLAVPVGAAEGGDEDMIVSAVKNGDEARIIDWIANKGQADALRCLVDVAVKNNELMQTAGKRYISKILLVGRHLTPDQIGGNVARLMAAYIQLIVGDDQLMRECWHMDSRVASVDVDRLVLDRVEKSGMDVNLIKYLGWRRNRDRVVEIEDSVFNRIPDDKYYEEKWRNRKDLRWGLLALIRIGNIRARKIWENAIADELASAEAYSGNMSYEGHIRVGIAHEIAYIRDRVCFDYVCGVIKRERLKNPGVIFSGVYDVIRGGGDIVFLADEEPDAVTIEGYRKWLVDPSRPFNN